MEFTAPPKTAPVKNTKSKPALAIKLKLKHSKIGSNVVNDSSQSKITEVNTTDGGGLYGFKSNIKETTRATQSQKLTYAVGSVRDNDIVNETVPNSLQNSNMEIQKSHNLKAFLQENMDEEQKNNPMFMKRYCCYNLQW